jgi:hypothetical protein
VTDQRLLQRLDTWYHENGEPWWAVIVCDIWELDAGVPLRLVARERLHKIVNILRYTTHGQKRRLW